MLSNEAIAALRHCREKWPLLIGLPQPLLSRILCTHAEGCLCSAVNAAIGFDQLNGGIELLARYFRKTKRNDGVLNRQVIHAVATDLLPALDPERAEAAIAVVNEQRFGGRRGDLRDVHRVF